MPGRKDDRAVEAGVVVEGQGLLAGGGAHDVALLVAGQHVALAVDREEAVERQHWIGRDRGATEAGVAVGTARIETEELVVLLVEAEAHPVGGVRLEDELDRVGVAGTEADVVDTADRHRTILGTPAQIADQLEEWFVGGAADGFNIMPPFLPGGLEEFVELVIPELQRRGLFRSEYEGTTLRENLGLPRPANRFSAPEPAASSRAAPVSPL